VSAASSHNAVARVGARDTSAHNVRAQRRRRRTAGGGCDAALVVFRILIRQAGGGRVDRLSADSADSLADLLLGVLLGAEKKQGGDPLALSLSRRPPFIACFLFSIVRRVYYRTHRLARI